MRIPKHNRARLTGASLPPTSLSQKACAIDTVKYSNIFNCFHEIYSKHTTRYYGFQKTYYSWRQILTHNVRFQCNLLMTSVSNKIHPRGQIPNKTYSWRQIPIRYTHDVSFEWNSLVTSYSNVIHSWREIPIKFTNKVRFQKNSFMESNSKYTRD